MPPHVTERSNASRYDGIEMMTIGLGVLPDRHHRLRVWNRIPAIGFD